MIFTALLVLHVASFYIHLAIVILFYQALYILFLIFFFASHQCRLYIYTYVLNIDMYVFVCICVYVARVSRRQKCSQVYSKLRFQGEERIVFIPRIYVYICVYIRVNPSLFVEHHYHWIS
jgi:hypothetical protein